MITQQQVYNYLQEQKINLEGNFYPDEQLYESSKGTRYKVKFLNNEYIGQGMLFNLFNPRIKSERMVFPKRISISAKDTLENVTESFVKGTLKAERKEFDYRRTKEFIVGELINLAAIGCFIGALTIDNDTAKLLTIPGWLGLMAMYPLYLSGIKKTEAKLDNFVKENYFKSGYQQKL